VTAMYYHVLSHTSATLVHCPSAVVAPRNRQIGLRGPSVLATIMIARTCDASQARFDKPTSGYLIVKLLGCTVLLYLAGLPTFDAT
jgi:hypothetical protein